MKQVVLRSWLGVGGWGRVGGAQNNYQLPGSMSFYPATVWVNECRYVMHPAFFLFLQQRADSFIHNATSSAQLV